MKVDKSSSIRGAGPARRSERAGARTGDFARQLEESGGASSASAVGGMTAASGIAGILSIQEVGDATTSRRRAVTHAETLLDRLDELRHGLLMGTLNRDQLVELSRLVLVRREQVDNPGLVELLDEIDLRAQVELAKYDLRSVS